MAPLALSHPRYDWQIKSEPQKFSMLSNVDRVSETFLIQPATNVTPTRNSTKKASNVLELRETLCETFFSRAELIPPAKCSVVVLRST